MIRKILVIFSFVLIVLMLATLFAVIAANIAGKASNKKKIETKTEKTEVLKTVNVQSVTLKTLPVTITGEGRVNSRKKIKVIAETQGRVVGGVNLKMGQSFRKGQLLYKIDSKEFNLGLKARRSTFITLLAGVLPDIKVDFPEQYVLWNGFFNALSPETNLPSFPTNKTVKEKTFVASKGISAEYYNIKSMEEKLKKYSYYAPFSGSVLASYTDKGAILNPGSMVVDIIQNGNLEVEIPLSTEAAKTIKVGSVVTLTDKGTEKEYTGRVKRKGNFVNASTQSIPVYVQLNSTKDLYNGMYLKATFTAGSIADAIVFPKRAIVDGNYVYLVKDSLLVKQQVSLVHQEANSSFVKGLKEGDVVVNEPILKGKEGMKITPIYSTSKTAK